MSVRLPALLLLFSGAASAHDFWIQPETYHVEPGVPLPITLQVGHGPARQRSMLPKRRITRFVAIAPDGSSVDFRENLDLGAATEDGELKLQEPGTHVVLLETDNHARTLDGSESYSRHSKALVQVGSASPSSQATEPLGMPLEIVPEVNPYAESPKLPVRVLFAGKPLAGGRIELTNLDHDNEPVATHITDDDGRSSFALPSHGKWLLNVIWKQGETYFSSLSFGR